MNHERFNAQNTALLLIDHQVGTMQLIKNIDKELAAKVVKPCFARNGKSMI